VLNWHIVNLKYPTNSFVTMPDPILIEVLPEQIVTAYGSGVVNGNGDILEVDYINRGANVKSKIRGPAVEGKVYLTIPTPVNVNPVLCLADSDPIIFPTPPPGMIQGEIYFNGELARRDSPYPPGTGIGVTLNIRFPLNPGAPREILITSVGVKLQVLPFPPP
jgi:hypothetical protein